MSTLSPVRLHHLNGLSLNPLTLASHYPESQTESVLLCPVFQLHAVSLAGLLALGGQLLDLLPLLLSRQCKAQVSAWPSETHALPLPVAAHVGILGVQREDGLQEEEDNELCP